MPKVSIIVPVYNVEPYLDRCIQSLRNQTLTDIEIILVDDESPDRCPDMCDSYAKQESRIKVIHKKNGGLGYARNSGLELAIGEYISFVDSDDYIDLDMLEQMYKAAKENNADFVRCDNVKETTDGRVLNIGEVSPVDERCYTGEDLRENLLYPQFGMLPQDDGSKYLSCSVWRNLYRHSIIQENNLLFVSERDLVSEDIPFNLDFMMRSQKAVVINKKFYHYIVNDSSLTQKYMPNRFEKEIVLYQDLIERSKRYGIYRNCAIRLQRHLLSRTRKCIKAELLTNPDRSQVHNNIKQILNHPVLRSVFAEYDISLMPLKYRMVAYAMKWRSQKLLQIVAKKL